MVHQKKKGRYAPTEISKSKNLAFLKTPQIVCFFAGTDCTTDALNKEYEQLNVENTADVSFINALVHIETGKCKASFDSVGSLTVRPSKGKRKTICTCNIKKRGTTLNMLQYLTLVLQN